ncbi:MAG: glucose-1-phosphate adenylyltransferase subunit GlgD [Clostridiales bacterium]|jgi:glucose-1-phosphate adenylyltransferase|nr:glucose-1-phosphate adenylyltransferase subunit GlgD [Clostridiales bacterium]
MRSIGIILAGGVSKNLGVLTRERAAAAMPVGGCYRAIDFSLSNMSNSGVSKVAIITQYNSRSLHNHLSSAKWWNFGYKHGRLFIFSPYISEGNQFWYRGTADAIYQNLLFLKKSHEKNVIISHGDIIFKINFNTVIDFHEKNNANITLIYKKKINNDSFNLCDFGLLEIDENNRLVNFDEKPLDPKSDNIFAGIYIFSRDMLIEILETILSQNRYDLISDIIIRYRKKLKIMAYEIKSYWNVLNNIESFYRVNFDFLNKNIRDEFLHTYPYIETKPKDDPPAKYNFNAKTKNSIVGSGSILNGYTENSILFNKVYIGELTSVKNSIIMDKCQIGNNCVVENAILDKSVVLSDNKKIQGSQIDLAVVSKHSIF